MLDYFRKKQVQKDWDKGVYKIIPIIVKGGKEVAQGVTRTLSEDEMDRYQSGGPTRQQSAREIDLFNYLFSTFLGLKSEVCRTEPIDAEYWDRLRNADITTMVSDKFLASVPKVIDHPELMKDRRLNIAGMEESSILHGITKYGSDTGIRLNERAVRDWQQTVDRCGYPVDDYIQPNLAIDISKGRVLVGPLTSNVCDLNGLAREVSYLTEYRYGQNFDYLEKPEYLVEPEDLESLLNI